MRWAIQIFTALFLNVSLATGLYAQIRLVESNDPNAVPRGGQSEIFFNAENSNRDIAVWINGAIAAHVRPKTREKIIISNRQNHVEAAGPVKYWKKSKHLVMISALFWEYSLAKTGAIRKQL